jgi:ankyrin repeat protein
VKTEVGSEFPIHSLIYKKDFVRLVQYFKRGAFTLDDINQKDHRGNTPIILAAKLSPKDDEFLKAVNYLFEKGANGKLRDSNGWSLIDEAICQQNTRLLAIAFD